MISKSKLLRNVALLTIVIITSIVVTIVIVESHEYYKKKQYASMVAHAIRKPVKVFQIGFSKCGTSTLNFFFSQNGISAIHHDHGRLAVSIYENAHNGFPLLSQNYEKFFLFTDMEKMYADPPISIPMLFFKELDRQYPGSKFILNTRDKQDWLKSRAKHPVGTNFTETLLEKNSQILKVTPEEVLERWSIERDQHHQAVIEYFKDRPDDLLIFDIDKDSPEKITAFFKDYFVLDPKLYKHINKTSAREEYLNRTDLEEEDYVEIFSKSYKIDPSLRKKVDLSNSKH